MSSRSQRGGTVAVPKGKQADTRFPARKSADRQKSVKSAREDEERPGLATRLVAAKLLAAVIDARTSLDGLTDPGHGNPQFRALEERDQGLVKAILQTALRFYGTIDRELSQRLDRPLPKNATALRHLLHVGAAQILYLDVPDSAAVDLAVAAASRDPRLARFSGLVNALLRRISREKRQADDDAGISSLVDCPAWLADRLIEQYGRERAMAIASCHRLPAPIDITVRSDAAGWAKRLDGHLVGPSTVRLSRLSGPITALDGYVEGAWWVQDFAASLPVRLFGDLRGKTAIDLCAAPGGKTAQLCLAGAAVTALDISKSRMRRLEDNLRRLKFDAATIVTDLGEFSPPAPFDAVLLDAPCSSTGTIRRHPDVAYTKDAAEIEKLAQVQARLLGQAAKLVAPNGRIVFSNCSLDRSEGEDVVAAFLAENAGFKRVPISPEEVPELPAAITAKGDVRTTPDMLADLGGLDGFYAARLQRVS